MEEKNKKEIIAAVVVTYNRKKLLKDCLDSVLNQTYPVNSIIIIDNASSDGTYEFLKQKEYFRSSIIDYMRLKENIGGAGGFNVGINKAYQKGFEWIWCMDDDVVAKYNAVETYLLYKNRFLFIQGRKENNKGKIIQWARHFNYRSGMVYSVKEDMVFKIKDYFQINVSCFEGAFINRKIVLDIGLPPKDFFIIDDDTFYGFKVSLKYPIAYIRHITLKKNFEARTKKVLCKNFTIPTAFSTYFTIRNKYLLERKIRNLLPNSYVNYKFTIIFLSIKIILRIILFSDDKKNNIRYFIKAHKDRYLVGNSIFKK